MLNVLTIDHDSFTIEIFHCYMKLYMIVCEADEYVAFVLKVTIHYVQMCRWIAVCKSFVWNAICSLCWYHDSVFF